jgi:hypothetical protein
VEIYSHYNSYCVLLCRQEKDLAIDALLFRRHLFFITFLSSAVLFTFPVPLCLDAMLVVAYATGRAFHARQVKGDDPDKKGYPGPPGWGFGLGLTTPHSKTYCYESPKKGKAGWI